MIEFRILIKDEDRLHLYLRSLNQSCYIKQYLDFEDVDQEWNIGFDKGITYLAKLKKDKYGEKDLYKNMTSMFKDLREYFYMEIEFRYVNSYNWKFNNIITYIFICMKQYLKLLQDIKDKGTWKDAARENMPRTLSLFGTQMRFNLQEGFPILTTKKISFKNIVTELLWFLKGDTNIKYLVDNGCNIWNEDAYNYYKKVVPPNHVTFEDFIEIIRRENKNYLPKEGNYIFGDCGKQYGWLWREWDGVKFDENWDIEKTLKVDQISELINGLKNNPTGRRHILTAWNPATLDDMALNACHCFVQFNCRPLSQEERINISVARDLGYPHIGDEEKVLDYDNIPKYYLDCKFTMRSNDVFLGNPYNVASYALLTHILAKICNMEVGDLIADLGDDIYENHIDQVNEQLKRTLDELPKLVFDNEFDLILNNYNDLTDDRYNNLSILIENLHNNLFNIENYNPQPTIKGKLSTGLIK